MCLASRVFRWINETFWLIHMTGKKDEDEKKDEKKTEKRRRQRRSYIGLAPQKAILFNRRELGQRVLLKFDFVGVVNGRLVNVRRYISRLRR